MGMKLHFLNVADGESTLIELPDGQLMIVDLNCDQDLDETSAAELASELRVTLSKGASRLAQMRESYAVALDNPLAEIADLVGENGEVLRYVQTHPDLDHMRGMTSFLQSHDVRHFWDTNHQHVSKTDFQSDSDEADWDAYTNRRKARICYERGKYIAPEGAEYRVHVFHPTADALSAGDDEECPDTNGFSQVLLVEYGEMRVLLTGDVTCHWWKDLYEWVLEHPKAHRLLTGIDILQAAHHGRDSGLCGWKENGSYSRAFLDLMNPSLVVVSVGKKPDTDKSNWYRRRLDGTDRQVWSTRWCGTIWAESARGEKPSYSTRFDSGLPQKQLVALTSLRLPIAYGTDKIKIRAKVSRTTGGPCDKPYNWGMPPLPKKRTIEFSLQSNIQEPCDVYWRITNNGDEAAANDGLRGELHQDDGAKTRQETTKYRGVHTTEAYVVKNGRVVACDILYVRIK